MLKLNRFPLLFHFANCHLVFEGLDLPCTYGFLSKAFPLLTHLALLITGHVVAVDFGVWYRHVTLVVRSSPLCTGRAAILIVCPKYSELLSNAHVSITLLM